MPVIGKKVAAKPVTKTVQKKGANDRPILYDKISIKLHDGKRDPFLTADDAKLLLGWQEEGPTEKFGNLYMLKDVNGKKIRCVNNSTNRPFKAHNAAKIKHQILKGFWKLNLESMIIGETGMCLSAQHRLIGLILACQEWEKEPEKYPFWKTAPTLACLIAFGCSEVDDVVNTIDTGEPRSIADVIYRSGYFEDVSPHHNEQLSTILTFAIRTLWYRNGVWDHHCPYKTHSEALETLNKHPRLVECARHIFTENGGVKKRINGLLPTGLCAGFMYIMGASATDASAYEENPHESTIDWSNWDEAVNFWVNFAARNKNLKPLFDALGSLGEKPTRDERAALLVKAWNCVINKEPITARSIGLKYKIDEDGVKILNDEPTIGGIDLPSWAKVEEQDDEGVPF